MNKIFIIGIVAGGKTTLARKLSEKLAIPLYELDDIVYDRTLEGRRKRTAEEQLEVLRAIDQRGQWILEGVDRTSYRCLYEWADSIVFLDPPLWKRRIRIFTRYLKQKLGIEKSHYKADITMLKQMYRWTQDFEDGRVGFEARLRQYESKVIVLTTNKEVKKLLGDESIGK